MNNTTDELVLLIRRIRRIWGNDVRILLDEFEGMVWLEIPTTDSVDEAMKKLDTLDAWKNDSGMTFMDVHTDVRFIKKPT